MRVSGCDLVYRIPGTLANDPNTLFCVIPCNPAYWAGTRIAQVAPAYTTYRPIRLTFSYIPQVAVTQEGTVAMGTIWNTAVGSEDIQQSLFTSNGGCLTQCYIPCDTRIELGSNLQQNLFQLKGELRGETNPFIFCAALAGAALVPGYFYVTYEFDFKNPIGESWTYDVSTPGTVSSLLATAPALPNVSAVLLSQSGAYGPGTIFDVEGTSLYYAGTPVTLDGSSNIQLFSNGQTQGIAAQVAQLRIAAATPSFEIVKMARLGGSYISLSNPRQAAIPSPAGTGMTTYMPIPWGSDSTIGSIALVIDMGGYYIVGICGYTTDGRINVTQLLSEVPAAAGRTVYMTNLQSQAASGTLPSYTWGFYTASNARVVAFALNNSNGISNAFTHYVTLGSTIKVLTPASVDAEPVDISVGEL